MSISVQPKTLMTSRTARESISVSGWMLIVYDDGGMVLASTRVSMCGIWRLEHAEPVKAATSWFNGPNVHKICCANWSQTGKKDKKLYFITSASNYDSLVLNLFSRKATLKTTLICKGDVKLYIEAYKMLNV
jgi:hypothetical protein